MTRQRAHHPPRWWAHEREQAAPPAVSLARPHPTGLYWLTRDESITWSRDAELRARSIEAAAGRTIVADLGKVLYPIEPR